MILRLAFRGLFIAVGCSWMVEFLRFADFFKVIHRQVPGACHAVENVYGTKDRGQGSEDIEILSTGLAIFSSGLNYMRNPVLKDVPGRMMTFNFNDSDAAAVELQIVGFAGKLNPHGIGLWTENDMTHVYIIHHAMESTNTDESVEKFLWDIPGNKLTHRRTIKNALFTSLNDLVLVGQDKFYVTNDYTFRHNWLRRLEYFSFLPTNNVVYFDGEHARIAAKYLRRANGINISPDGRYLYVAESGAKRLSTFEIQPNQNVDFLSTEYLGTIVDNIFVYPPTGDIYLGTHPVGYKIFQKVAFPVGTRAPSQVLRLKMKDGRVTSSEQIYADNGDNLIASGTAAFFRGSLLIGTPTHKLMYCECLIC